MKKSLPTTILLLLTVLVSYSQTNLSFLLDVTDPRLFSMIKDDIKMNFSTFMITNDFGKLQEGEKLSMNWASISSSGTLDFHTRSIAGPSRSLSLQVQRKHNQQNASSMLAFKNTELQAFETQANQKLTNTSIAKVLLKALTEAAREGDNYLFVMSDLIENNGKVNFYKKIPQPIEFYKTLDPTLVKMVQSKITLNPVKVIFVLKSLPDAKTKVDEIALKSFWIKLLAKVGETNVQFIDNLGNSFDH